MDISGRVRSLLISFVFAAAGCGTQNGVDGTSCSVNDNGDGTKTISCEDGTSAVLHDGVDGQDGGNAVASPTYLWDCTGDVGVFTVTKDAGTYEYSPLEMTIFVFDGAYFTTCRGDRTLLATTYADTDQETNSFWYPSTWTTLTCMAAYMQFDFDVASNTMEVVPTQESVSPQQFPCDKITL